MMAPSSSSLLSFITVVIITVIATTFGRRRRPRFIHPFFGWIDPWQYPRGDYVTFHSQSESSDNHYDCNSANIVCVFSFQSVDPLEIAFLFQSPTNSNATCGLCWCMWNKQRCLVCGLSPCIQSKANRQTVINKHAEAIGSGARETSVGQCSGGGGEHGRVVQSIETREACMQFGLHDPLVQHWFTLQFTCCTANGKNKPSTR